MTIKIPYGTKFQFDQHTFRFGQEVVELTDSSTIKDNPEALRSRFQEDGYLFIRGFHDAQKSQLAASFTLGAIADRGGIKEGTPIESGIVGRENQSFRFFRQTEVAHAKEILDLVDSNDTFRFFERFFHNKKVITFDKRWLRCMANGGCNHFHYDQVYVGRGTPNRCTMWSALTDISLEDGPLVSCLGSHQHKKLRETYGKMDMDRDLIDAVFTSAGTSGDISLDVAISSTDVPPTARSSTRTPFCVAISWLSSSKLIVVLVSGVISISAVLTLVKLPLV